MVTPLKPADMQAAQAARIPDEVIEVVNELLAKEFSNGRATLLQKDVIAALCNKMMCTRESVFANRWLDFEPAFRQAGWKVSYDKPAYNESYEARYEFRIDRRGQS
jgi:hypothetical protein